MAYKVRMTASAERDLDGIAAYILTELGNPQAARHVLDEVDALIHVLAETLNAYAACTHPLLQGHRKAAFMRYVMIYKVAGDMVDVERFFSELEDYAHKL